MFCEAIFPTVSFCAIKHLVGLVIISFFLKKKKREKNRVKGCIGFSPPFGILFVGCREEEHRYSSSLLPLSDP